MDRGRGGSGAKTATRKTLQIVESIFKTVRFVQDIVRGKHNANANKSIVLFSSVLAIFMAALVNYIVKGRGRTKTLGFVASVAAGALAFTFVRLSPSKKKRDDPATPSRGDTAVRKTVKDGISALSVESLTMSVAEMNVETTQNPDMSIQKKNVYFPKNIHGRSQRDSAESVESLTMSTAEKNVVEPNIEKNVKTNVHESKSFRGKSRTDTAGINSRTESRPANKVVLLRCSPKHLELESTGPEVEYIKKIWTSKEAKIPAEVYMLASGDGNDLLRRLLIGVTVLHIAAHMDNTTLGAETIVFCDKRGKPSILPADVVVRFIASARCTLKVVVLNGCRSHKMAMELVKCGVPYVIAWKTKVNDKAAKIFGCAFHEALATDMKNPSEAFEYAKLQVEAKTYKPPVDILGKINKYVLKDPDTSQYARFETGEYKGYFTNKAPIDFAYRKPVGIPVAFSSKVFEANRRCAPSNGIASVGFVEGLREQDLKVVIDMLLRSSTSEGANHTKERNSSADDSAAWVYGLSGFAGLGKSTVAWQACRSNAIKNHFSYGGIFWLRASVDDVASELRNLAHDLLAMHVPDADAPKEVAKYTNVENLLNLIRNICKIRWPKDDQAPVLVVLDDVWDASRVAELVPLDVLPLGSAVLVTFRDRRVGTKLGVRLQHTLDVLSPEASLMLLRDICRVEPPKDAALAVAKRLGYHPMALNIVSREVASREEDDGPMYSPRESKVWKETLSGFDAEIADINTDERSDDLKDVVGYEEKRRHVSVFASIALSCKRLKKRGKRRGRHRTFDVDFLRTAYRKLAIFSEDATIPPMALTHIWTLRDEIETKACAGIFVQAGLLEISINGVEDEYISYHLHDLCRDYVRWRVQKESGRGIVREMQHEFVKWLSGEEWKESLTADGDDRSRRVYTSGWEQTFEAAAGMEITKQVDNSSDETSKVIYEFSRLLQHFGRFVEAKRMAKMALIMRKNIHGTTHPEVAISMRNLGVVCHKLGDLVEAVEMLQSCLRMQYDRFGTDKPDPEIAKTLKRLGGVLFAQGDYRKAKKMYDRCLEISCVIYGSDQAHPEIADLLGISAKLCRRSGDIEEAKKLQQQCLDMYYDIYGTDKAHPSIAKSLDSLGEVFLKLGDYGEAKAKYEASLKIRYALYGTEKAHPEIATSLKDLAVVYRRMGNLKEAKNKHEASLKMRYAIYGTDKAHPEIAGSLNNLAIVLQNLGELEEAKEKYEACLKMKYVIYGTDGVHRSIATSLFNLGVVLEALGNLEEAKKKYEASLEMEHLIYGTKKAHPSIAIGFSHYGELLYLLKDFNSALNILNKSLEMFETVYGKGAPHVRIAQVRSRRAEVLANMGQISDAILDINLSLAIFSQKYKNPHIYVANAYRRHGDILLICGHKVAARKSYEISLEMMYLLYGRNRSHYLISPLLVKLKTLG
eukprot:g3595.t1